LFVPRDKRFKPRKFLKLASKLVNDDNYEEPCRIRTSIGRAYYAAFLYVKERMEEIGYHFPDDHTVHIAVRDNLMDIDTKLGSQLDRLLEKRVTADYHMDQSLSPSEGSYCTNVSQRIIDDAELLRTKKK
jgi:uncharacterized protein (UPF0332 family)